MNLLVDLAVSIERPVSAVIKRPDGSFISVPLMKTCSSVLPKVYLTMILSHCILQRSLTSGKMVSG